MKKKKKKQARATVVPQSSQKIRLGYLSSDFGTGRTRDLLPAFFFWYDRARFDIYAYHTGMEGDTASFAKNATLREIGHHSPQEAAEEIQRDKIDLLVDLSLRMPDGHIRSIMQLRPAPYIVSLAADCPKELAERLPSVEGDEIFSHCYTPFERVQHYTYRTPLLDTGVPSIGVAGELQRDEAEQFVTLVVKLLQGVHVIRLILPARVAEGLSEEDFARIAEAGSEDAVLELVDELPYEVLDLVVGVDVDLVDVCRAADHGVPLLTTEASVCGHRARMLLEKLELMPAYNGAELVAEIGRLLSDQSRLSEFHECLHWWLLDLFDGGAVMFSVERAYSRVFAQMNQEQGAEITKTLLDAASREDWETVLFAAHALDGMNQLEAELRMSLAWAYYFLGQGSHAGRWALAATGLARDREAARLYLSVISKSPPGKGQEIYERARYGLRLIEEGLPAVPEVRAALLKACMIYAGLVQGGEAASTYTRLYAMQAEKTEMRRFYYGASLFHLNAVDLPAAEVYQRSLHYGELFSDVQPYSHMGRRKKEKIRIGYISGDFRQHVMQYFIWPFLAGFDQDSFEVYVYSLGEPDQFSQFFQTLVTCWRDLSDCNMDMAEIAGKIYRDEIDILFDLAGHTAESGLAALAWKPAPIQLSGLGYMATTGLPAVDYFVTDHYCDPEGGGSEQVYVEKLLRLTSQFCYNGYTHLPASDGAPARHRGYILFASFNQYRKIRDDMLVAWRQIMERIPNSRLLLKNSAYQQPGVAMTAYQRLKEMGFDMSRVTFEPGTKDYMMRYLDVDIALDTFPWPGGGTTCDALYMGVPVISYYTERHSTRFSYSILANMGLAELASERMEDYIETAVALAGNLDLLDALHRELRPRMKASPVMDQEGYIREMEGCYRAIWAAWEARQGAV